jgi:predicted transcriptional regulator
MHEAMRITEAEWLVCQVLWRHSPQTANEIVDKLAGKTDWNPRTIKTLLNRLVNKNVIGLEPAVSAAGDGRRHSSTTPPTSARLRLMPS